MTAPTLPSEPPMTQDNSKAQLVDAPEHIWLLDYGSGECVWCNCPDPDAEDHEPVKYVRADLIEALTRPQPSTSSVEAVARAELLEWASQHSNVTPLDGTDRDSPTFGDLRAALAALPSPEREWQPIERAPHGEEVLLYSPSTFGGQVAAKLEVGCAAFGEVRGGYSNRSWHGTATHWMPLPAPPPAQSGDRT